MTNPIVPTPPFTPPPPPVVILVPVEKVEPKKLRWLNLNYAEQAFAKKYLMNGCGPGGIIAFMIPEFNFTESCNHHDFNYFLRGTEEDRTEADRQFLEAMFKVIDTFVWWRRPLNHALALLYYQNVHTLGKKFFTYGPQVTWEEFHKLMKEHGYNPLITGEIK